MATDKEKLITLLTEFGVGFKEEARITGAYEVLLNATSGSVIICEEGAEKVDGWSGFFTFFEFDADGAFVQMGAAE